jgi:hypothetical protein
MTLFLPGNRSGHHNTDLKTCRHIIEQHEKQEPSLKREDT